MRLSVLLLCLASAMYADSAGGLKWTAPAGWKSEGARPMRAATYTVDRAECAVNFFGAAQGGGVDENIERWKGQFRQPAEAKVGKRTVHGITVTTIDISGDYSGMGGPMAAERKVMPGYRLLGAIAQGPGGNVFFKFAGPAKTVAANQQKFEQMLASIAKE
jgi:hypothetical protein